MDIQVFVVSPRGRTTSLFVDPTSTISDFRRAAASCGEVCEKNETLPSWDPKIVRLSANGKPILSETATLQQYEISDGTVIRTYGRLRGGANLNLVVKTKFGM